MGKLENVPEWLETRAHGGGQEVGGEMLGGRVPPSLWSACLVARATIGAVRFHKGTGGHLVRTLPKGRTD